MKSNNILDTIDEGIDVGPNLKASVIEDNTIMTVIRPGSLDVTGTGIELNCNKVSSGHVKSNTLVDSLYGYGDAPAGFTGSNTYVGVVTQVSTCASDAPLNKASAAARLKLLGQSLGAMTGDPVFLRPGSFGEARRPAVPDSGHNKSIQFRHRLYEGLVGICMGAHPQKPAPDSHFPKPR